MVWSLNLAYSSMVCCSNLIIIILQNISSFFMMYHCYVVRNPNGTQDCGLDVYAHNDTVDDSPGDSQPRAENHAHIIL